MSAVSGGVSTICFTTVIGAPAGIASASFTLVFSLKAHSKVWENFWQLKVL